MLNGVEHGKSCITSGPDGVTSYRIYYQCWQMLQFIHVNIHLEILISAIDFVNS